jgi:poly(A) polymerase
MDAYQHATGIVNKLVRAGHVAYFAGGWVRDYVMGHPSEDIDIATSASPAEIMDLFPNTILVGLAFGVVIVPIGGHQFEVATFRKDLAYEDGRRPIGFEPSTPQEDAQRRDFTINGMFFDPLDGSIHDHVHGREDIKRQIIRTIGDPHERFFEDRLRMLRAFRFAARFCFNVEPETQEAIREHAHKLLPAVALERVWQEFTKMAAYPRFDQALVEMHRLELLDVIFPEVEHMHVDQLRHIVKAFTYFPKNCPAILYLGELFPNQNVEQKIDIFKRLTAPNREIKLLELLESIQAAQQEQNSELWAHLYAKPYCQLCLEIIAARYVDQAERAQFLSRHAARLTALEAHVWRIREHKPLVSAALLQQNGVQPGKHMGALLKAAESIAIEQNSQDPQAILNQLKHMPIWRES